MNHRLRRARIGLSVAGLVMLIGLGLLLRGALDAATREQQLRRQALAARVFDELEVALASLIAGEEARPFVQWRREWLGPDGLVRSPLAAAPKRDFVLGYFQIEPNGGFASPLLPGPDEPPPSPELRARVERLRGLSRELGEPAGEQRPAAGAGPELAQAQPQAQAQAQQQASQGQALPEDVQIQRALDQRALDRQRKNAVANQEAFAPDLEQLSSFVGPGNRLFEAGEAGEAAPSDALDLRVTGFVGEPRGEVLRLVRTVEIAGQRWIQGLVLDRAALARWLEQEVLGGPELAGLVELDWHAAEKSDEESAGSDPEAGRWTHRWTHRFAPPFAALEVSAELGSAHALSSPGARVILALALALALALILVLVAVERTLAGMIARAEERERFIAAVTHELRTPLTSIRMYSEMLEQGMVADPERQRSYHGTIRGEAERLSRLVEQVLTLARLDDPRRESIAVGELASLESIVAGVVELLAPQAAARALELELRLDDGAATTELPADALAQILTNLVDNAIKFSPVAGEAIEITGEREREALRLRVRDRGPGVAAELLPRMFEAFVRARREHEQATPGTGIGLAVVEALVAELDGRVVARNHPRGGLEVELELPVLAPAARG